VGAAQYVQTRPILAAQDHMVIGMLAEFPVGPVSRNGTIMRSLSITSAKNSAARDVLASR
jgi:hypothetical protein